MEIENAIGILEEYKNCKYSHCYLDEIINLLREFENYKDWTIGDFMKLFGKRPVKKTITIEFEAKNEIDISWLKNLILDYLKKFIKEYTNAYDDIKLNIKEEK